MFKGKNDKIAADKAAVDEMRNELNKIDMKGTIVIGERRKLGIMLPCFILMKKVGHK